MKKPKVLIMIPAYNESRVIRLLVKEIIKLYPQYDLVVINDGSTDPTRQEAEKGGAITVNLPFNLGIGGAVQTGFRIGYRLGYDAVVQIDGDAQHSPAYLNQVLEPVLKGEVDLCIGSRFLDNRSPFKSTFTRRLGIKFFSVLLRGLTGFYLTDPTSGYRATGRKLIKRFSDYYPIDFPEPEAVKMAKRFGATVREVPVKMHKRIGGQSSIRYWKPLYYMVKVTFAILIDALKKK